MFPDDKARKTGFVKTHPLRRFRRPYSERVSHTDDDSRTTASFYR